MDPFRDVCREELLTDAHFFPATQDWQRYPVFAMQAGHEGSQQPHGDVDDLRAAASGGVRREMVHASALLAFLSTDAGAAAAEEPAFQLVEVPMAPEGRLVIGAQLFRDLLEGPLAIDVGVLWLLAHKYDGFHQLPGEPWQASSKNDNNNNNNNNVSTTCCFFGCSLFAVMWSTSTSTSSSSDETVPTTRTRALFVHRPPRSIGHSPELAQLLRLLERHGGAVGTAAQWARRRSCRTCSGWPCARCATRTRATTATGTACATLSRRRGTGRRRGPGSRTWACSG
jgi:hypothetical protein